ncbi:FKBP-type peptidyl-prolyl cis-trans isomerase [Devriesea agamarum]|uniref:FKBP-type peptidyl-prolyl cis-trans isomerase n=1 Tax=Devriesea agamarum TaxID=472569 RepID=UPI00071E1CFE|nr:FKBP-type peptidyl-prolyl cis-trans isomerase [Devriesea agamarum]
MLTRRRLLTSSGAAATVLGAIALSGCGDKDSGKPASSTAPSNGPNAGAAILDRIKVSTDLSKEPEITFTAPMEINKMAYKVVTEGKGKKLQKGQAVIFKTKLVGSSDGKTVASTWKGDKPLILTLTDKAIGKDAVDFFTGTSIGSRLLTVGPAQSQDGSTLGMVQVLDAVDVIPSRASGNAVAPTPGMPAFTLADDGAPNLSAKPSGQPPTKTKSAVTIKGSGRQTKNGDRLIMQYRGWTWDDGKEFDSSWKRGELFDFVLGSGQVIKGWDSTLVGQTVGSQLELVIPPSDAYGDQGQLAHKTLVFVVDILYAFSPES